MPVARDVLHHEQLVREFVRRDPALHEEAVQGFERHRGIRGGRHSAEDAVANDGVWQHEARRIEKPGKRLIEPVELARGNREAAMIDELWIARDA